MEEEHQGYAISMGSSAIFYVFSVLLAAMILFHVYFQCWLLLRLRLQPQDDDPEGDAEDPSSGHHHHRITAATVITSRGLDPSAIMSLPSFLYDAKNQEPRLECAVCISEFQHNEAGRVLPGCNHHFHVDCIDMWLQSHRNCPLCRARVKGQPGMNWAETSGNSSSTGPGVVMGLAHREVFLMGLSSSRTVDAGPMEHRLTKIEEDPDTDGSGSDLELGLSTPAYSTHTSPI